MRPELFDLIPPSLVGPCCAHVLGRYRDWDGSSDFVEALFDGVGRVGLAPYSLITALYIDRQRRSEAYAAEELRDYAEWRDHLSADGVAAIKRVAIEEAQAINRIGRRAQGRAAHCQIRLKMRRAFDLGWTASQYVAHAFVDPWVRGETFPASVQYGYGSTLSRDDLHVPTPPRPERPKYAPATRPRPVVRLESPIEVQFWDSHLRLDLPLLRDLTPQVPILHYRADFAIPSLRLTVELDGHDYHSSKEQKARDTTRQREILLAGWQTIRFTGSEIHKDADRCVREVAKLAEMMA